MHLVYSFAKSVVIWLGPSDRYSRVAMEFSAKLDAARFIHEYGVQNRTTMEVLTEIPRKTYLFDPEVDLGVDLSEDVITSLVRFISRPWFGRVWVLQEAAGCQEMRVLCGDDQILWDQLFSLAWIIRSESPGMLPSYLPDTFSLVQRKAFAILRMHQIRLYRFPKGDRDVQFRPLFSTILGTAHLHEATDPRDKIYSAMNLSMSRERIMDLDLFFHRDDHTGITGYANWGLKADYTIPWEILYAQISLELLQRGYFSTLADSGRYKQPVPSVIPSWVIDFREQPSNTEIPENSGWMAGGRCRGPTAVPNPQSIVKVGILPKAHRRIFDTSLMSKEFKTCDTSLKTCLNTFVGLHVLMRDEIVWLSTDEFDGDTSKSHDLKSIGITKSQRILNFIIMESSQAIEAPTKEDGHYMNGEPLLSAYKLTLLCVAKIVSHEIFQSPCDWDSSRRP
jgi:hypothetical protein